MKKPSSRIREEIAKLQEQLKQAETREAERIGRVALRAGLGEIEIEETYLQAALEDLAKRFRGGKPGANGKERGGASSSSNAEASAVPSGAVPGSAGET
jgi:hypothetical protein